MAKRPRIGYDFGDRSFNLWRQITLFVASNHVVGLCEAQAQAQRSNQPTTTASCCSVVLLAPVGTAFSLFNFGLDVA